MILFSLRQAWRLASVCLFAFLSSLSVFSQDVVISEDVSGTIRVDGGLVVPSGGTVVSPVAPAAEQPPSAEQSTKEGEQPKEGEEAQESKENKEEGSETDTIKRPTEPPKIADPRELEAKPDSNGKVTFNFNGQLWPDVLQWLANVSGKSLDWTELPAGYLNLTTQRPYSLPEARDLINRQLYARGYTMIASGDVLSVFKIAQLDPSLIPRVNEEELYDRQPADFVKIAFQMPAGMEVAAAAEDIKKTAGEHTKVIPLPATRRVLLITTVAHARLVSTILNEERMAADSRDLPAEIVLRHRRAERIIDILYVVLGLDPTAQPSQEELAIRQQKMQLLMQMQGSGVDVSRMLKKDGPEVYLAFNSHRNSVLVNAPPEQLKTIRRTIELLDVPADGGPVDLAASTGRRVPKSYKLETINPTTLLTTLEEIGDLSPLTELRADNKADILFARATEGDHTKIEEMIEQLDEAGMETVVFTLQKHPADAVAGTLRTMFAPKKDDKKEQRDWYYYGYGYRQNDQDDDKPSDVRIDADIENNRLIVRATPEQLKQIRDFLIQLGEPLDQPERKKRLRLVEAMPPADTAQLLEQLRKAWPQIGENELRIEGPGFSRPEPPAVEPTENDPPADSTEPTDGQAIRPLSRFRFAVDDSEGDAPESPKKRSPIVVRIAPDGRLLLSSDDTQALDELEELIESISPPQERFHVIEVQYVRAFSIYLTLKNLYEEEIKGEKTDGYFDRYMWEYVPSQDKKTDPQLSKRKKLKLDYDIGSNTLLVANASPTQLREIRTLIELYDRPSDGDSTKTRRTAAIKLKYSRAKVVAAALKEVYRDLLSSRDKEFESEEKKGASIARETTTIIRYGQSGNDSGDTKRPTPVKVGFQGALSVGVDEISNTIIISVQEELFDSVLKIVESLDQAAEPQTTVAVQTLSSGVSPEALQKALADALGDPWVGGKPEKLFEKAQQQEQQNAEGQRQQAPQPVEGQPASE